MINFLQNRIIIFLSIELLKKGKNSDNIRNMSQNIQFDGKQIRFGTSGTFDIEESNNYNLDIDLDNNIDSQIHQIVDYDELDEADNNEEYHAEETKKDVSNLNMQASKNNHSNSNGSKSDGIKSIENKEVKSQIGCDECDEDDDEDGMRFGGEINFNNYDENNNEELTDNNMKEKVIDVVDDFIDFEDERAQENAVGSNRENKIIISDFDEESIYFQ